MEANFSPAAGANPCVRAGTPPLFEAGTAAVPEAPGAAWAVCSRRPSTNAVSIARALSLSASRHPESAARSGAPGDEGRGHRAGAFPARPPPPGERGPQPHAVDHRGDQIAAMIDGV